GYNDKKNAYIASQGPRDWNIEDMFSMIWQEKSNTIVMLADLVEMGKEKCSRYWPEKGNPQTWGIFVVEGISEEKFADYVIRKFTLKNEKSKMMRRMRQLHFTGWPDKGTPEYAYPLLAFHRKVHGFDSEKRGPFVVHCSAGVGRTGTFIAIDILIEQAKAEGKVDVFQCVNLLRTQRMNMVQTLEQYIYVYQALIEFNEVAVIPCSDLRQTFEGLCRNNKLAEQFERLNALKPHCKNARCAALEPKNVANNRFIEIIPDDHQRPYLVTPWKGGTNYINAVYVHECVVYWPTKKTTKQQYGPFGVELVETDITENANVTVREFKLNKSGRVCFHYIN
ncbi:Receptor-type tyrosine-protein phosphatase T, partial [Lamellibrachia satsuma]